jgi:hypothetical protein
MLKRALHNLRRWRKQGCELSIHRLALPAFASLILQFFVAPTFVFGQGSLTQVKIAPSDSAAGAGTIYTIRFVTSSAGIPQDGKIRLTFPAGFNITTVSLAVNDSGLTSGYLAPADTGQVLTLKRDGNGNNLTVSDTVVFKMAVVGNSKTAASYRLFVETLTGAGAKLDTATSAPFRIVPGPVNRFAISNIDTVTAGTLFAFTITAKDAHNNTVTTFTGPVNLSDNTGTLTPLSTVIVANGTVTVSNAKITKATAGVRITAVSGSVSGASNAFFVRHGALHHFAVTNTAGVNIGTQTAGMQFNIKITAQDTFSNTVTSFNSGVTLSNTTSSINPLNSGNFTNGVLSSLQITISKSSNADQITVTNGSPTKTGTSNPFAVNAGNLAGFQIAPVSSPQAAGVPFPLIVTAVDANQNTVTGFVGTVSISLNSGSVTPAVSGNFVGGVWNGNVTALTSGANKTITVSDGTFFTPSNTFNVNPGTATTFAVTDAGNGNIANQIAGQNFSIKITAKDANGNVATGFTGTVTLTANTLTPTSATISSGGTVTVNNANITKAQASVSVTAVSGSVTGASNPFAVSHAGLDHFAVTNTGGGNITSQTAGTPFNVRIVAQDEFGNTVTSHTGPGSAVTLANATNSISPASSGNFTNGAVPSLAVTISQTSNVDSITVSGAATGSSNSFAVNPGALADFRLSPISSPQIAGTQFPLTITAVDDNGNVFTGFTGTVTISLNSGNITPQVSGNFVAGVWNGNVTVLTSGAGKTISVTDGTRSETSNSFDVNSGALDHFEIANVPTPRIAGQNFTVTVTAKDFNNNNVSYTGTVILSDNTGTLTASSLVFNGQSTQSVNDVQITKAQSVVFVRADGSGKTGRSNDFIVSPASLDHFTVTNTSGDNIGSQTAGTAFNIRIVARDAFENTVTGFSQAVTITDLTSLNVTSGNFTGGVLASQSLTINEARSDNQLSVTGGSPSRSGTSNLFNVNAGPLDHFTIDTITDQAAGEFFAIVVRARDEQNNEATSFNGTVTLSDLTNTITPSSSGAFNRGVWSGNVKITQTRANDVITVNGGGKTGDSNPFNVTASTIDHFDISNINNLTADNSFDVTITAKDASNNTVNSFNGTVAISDLSGSIAPATSNAFNSGTLTQSFTITKSYTADKITVTGVGKSSSSNAFDVAPAPLARFDISNVPNRTAGVSFSITITAQDNFGNTYTNFNGTVAIFLNSGTITPGASEAFVNGVRTESVTIPNAGTNKIINVDDGSGHTGASNPFNVDPSGLARFDFSLIATQAAGTPFSFIITAKDANGNDVNHSGTVFLSDNTTTLNPASVEMNGTSATVTGAQIFKAQSGVEITASSAGKTGKSSPFTVQPGPLYRVRIVQGSSGAGQEFTTASPTADETLPLHAAAYDAFGNYRDDQPVNWSVTNSIIGTFNPATSSSSTTFFANKVGTGKIIADHATAIDDTTGDISVRPGAARSIKILEDATGNRPEVLNRTLTTGQKIVMHASSFDGDGNYVGDVSVSSWNLTSNIGSLNPSAGFSTEFTAVTAGTGTITATHSTLGNDATGTITVNKGLVSYIKILEGPSGSGTSEVGNLNLSTDDRRVVHAAGYDASNNYLGDQNVTWSILGNPIGMLSTISGTSTELDPRAPGAARIVADHDNPSVRDDSTGVINVSVGAARKVKVLLGASGPALEVGDQTLTTGDSLVVHASSFDADDNWKADVSVTWRLSINIGNLIPGIGVSTKLKATRTGSAVITADHASLDDGSTGIITVNFGQLSYIKIYEGQSSNTREVFTDTLTTDEQLPVHAAGFDASGVYLGDYDVTWGLSSNIGTLSANFGKFTILNPKTPGTGFITATHASAAGDNTSTITVTPGSPDHIKILDGRNGNTSVVLAPTLSTGDSLVVHASSFDADDNWLADEIVAWNVSGGIGTLSRSNAITTTLRATTAGSGVITARHVSLGEDATGTITVNAGSLSRIRIVEGPNGGAPLGNRNDLNTDLTLTVYAAGYDDNNNFLGNKEVAWSLIGDPIGTLSTANGTSTTLILTKPGTARLVANHASAQDDTTGDLTVSAGTLNRVKVFDGIAGNTGEVTSRELTADGTLIVHAAGFDADNNYIGDFPVNWSVSNQIGTFNPVSDTSTTFTARKVGEGRITADHLTAIDGVSGIIKVRVGALAFIKIIAGPSGGGNELGNDTLTTDQTLTVHAAGFDADTNFVADQEVNWSSTGALEPVVAATGKAFTFEPTKAPVTGTIRATQATTGFVDETGTITVQQGRLSRVKILSDRVGETTPVGATSLFAGDTLVVHAGGYDADDNYIADEIVAWSVDNPIGTVSPANGISTKFTAVNEGTSAIRANHPAPGIPDAVTGTIRVNRGSVAKIILRTASNNGGTVFNAGTLTADEEVTVYAAGHDIGNTYLGDFPVTWSSTGNLTPQASGTGSSFKFSPTLANADGSVNGVIIGTYSPTIKDSTGLITVLPGNPRGDVVLTPDPPGLPSDGNARSTITSAMIEDADGNEVGAGKLFTVTMSPQGYGTIVTPDASALPGHQVATQANSQLNFEFKAGTTGGVVDINVTGGLGATGSVRISLGSLRIVNVTTSPTTVSRGQTGITVNMLVENLSTEPITELTGTLTFTGSADRTGEYNVTPPNPITLPGSSPATLSFVVAVDANATLELVTINGAVSGKVNGTPVSAQGAQQTDSWTVQLPATLTVQQVIATRDTVKQGEPGLTVTVRVTNNVGQSNSAAASIDSVRLSFLQGGQDKTFEYAVAAEPGNPTTIPGGEAKNFSFVVNVGSSATLGQITLDASAYGKDANSNKSISDPNADNRDNWLVIEGEAFHIVSITPSQSLVTSGMTKSWTVRMELENVGSSNIRLNLAPDKTYIRFRIGSLDVTGEYGIDYPTELDEGGDVLTAGSTGHLTFTINPTGNTKGIATISGFAEGQDLAIPSLTVSDNTNDFGAGEVTVQSRGSLNITQLQKSQAEVTASRGKDWTITATVSNGGESAIQLRPDSTKIVIGNNAGYVYRIPNTFSDGSSILGNRETKSFVITVDSTGSEDGDQTIAVTLKGTEINSDRPVTSNRAESTIAVQSQANLQITAVRASRQTVTAGQGTAWNVTLTARNNGGSRVSLKADTASTNLRFRIAGQFRSGYNYSLERPTWLGTSSLILVGGATDSLRFVVSTTGSDTGFANLWAKVAAIEMNSNVTISSNTHNTSSVQVQSPPNVIYVAGSMKPDTVNNNSSYAFEVKVRNRGGATVQLNPTTTVFRFAGGSATFSARLDQNNATTLRPGETTLTFLSERIPANMPPGAYTPVVELHGAHNGNTFDDTLSVDTNELVVSEPAQVQLVEVSPSQPTVTAGMGKDWYVTAVIANNGGAPVKLSGAGLLLINVTDVTGDFGIVPPDKFIRSNDNILRGNDTDTLRFAITSTGNREGSTSIQCAIAVIDQSNGETRNLSGNTGVMVQSRASIRIDTLLASQPSVTIGQQDPYWTVDMKVTNDGDSEVEIDFDSTKTNILLGLNDPQNPDYTIRKPVTLLSGGKKLGGRASGTLRYTITQTGVSRGNNIIRGQIAATELNSGEARTDNTEDRGSTLVVVQTPAKLRISKTELAGAPNAPHVNTGQSFSVQVTVDNRGEEAADSVQIGLEKSGFSQIIPLIRPIVGGIAGNNSQVATFSIVASDLENPSEEFKARIVTAKARNTKKEGFREAPLDDTAPADIQREAELLVERVTPSQDTVRAGQPERWFINVALRNIGGADLMIAPPPSPGDIAIFIDDTVRTDYVIEAPRTLKQNGTLILAGDEADTLVYTVTSTGVRRGGQARIQASISGRDRNNDEALSEEGSGQVFVQTTARVQILTTNYIVNHERNGVGLVNVNQTFGIKVQVYNSGFEDVKDVVVRLSRDRSSRPEATEKTIAEIKAQQTGETTFSVVADTTNPAGEVETFTATLVSAVTSLNGQPALILTVGDTLARVLVQRPAQLAIEASINDTDKILTTNQLFEFTATVKNRGQALIDGTGEITLVLPPGFTIHPNEADSVKSFSADTEVSWQVRAPNDEGEAVLRVQISQRPVDLNSGERAQVTANVATIGVKTVYSALTINQFFISAPQGASDGILSTGQEFTIEANITYSQDLTNREKTLKIPPGLGYEFVRKDSLQPDPYNEIVRWRIKAPIQAQLARADFVVRVTGTTGRGDQADSDTVSVEGTVPHAILNLAAGISEPSGAAQENKVSFGQTFKIRARLTNTGVAGVKDTARVRLDWGQLGLTTSDSVEKNLAAGSFVEWNVTAPYEVRSDLVTIQFLRIPSDENTDAQAALFDQQLEDCWCRRFEVRVDSSAYLRILDFAIVEPAGAIDGIVSTEQTFIVRAIIAGKKAINVEAELFLPPDLDFSMVSSKIVTLGELEDGRQSVTWAIRAPNLPTSGRSEAISMVVRGRDKNNNLDQLAPVSDQLGVEVVEKARLVLSGEITSPPKAAIDGIVSRNQMFEVTARLSPGGALALGQGTVKLTLPRDTSLDSAEDYRTDEPLQKPLLANGVATWRIWARSKPSTVSQTIGLELQEPYPTDENTGAPVIGVDPTDQIAIQTEPVVLRVQTLPTPARGPIARGETDALMMRLKLTNAGNSGTNNILLRGFTLHVRDRNGAPVVGSQVVTALRVVDSSDSTRVLGQVTSIPPADSITVAMTVPDTLVGGIPDTVEVLVDVANTDATSFRLAFMRKEDIDAIDQDSPGVVEIIFMDDKENQVDPAEVASRTRVLSNADFQEFFNYPNPFDPNELPEGWLGTKFTYYLPQASDVEFRIYTLLGELVYSRSFNATDLQGREGPHDGDIVWDGKNDKLEKVLNGVYIAILKANAGTVTTKVAVVK